MIINQIIFLGGGHKFSEKKKTCQVDPNGNKKMWGKTNSQQELGSKIP